MKQDQLVLSQASANYQALGVKCRHLTSENHNLRESLKDFQNQIQSLRTVNEQIIKAAPQSIQLIISQLSKQNLSLEKALLRQIKNSQELACDVLLKNQLITQNQCEYRQIISNYENKIYELRVNLQTKQAFFSNQEDKALAEKDELYNMPNKNNLSYFNQMNELKLLIERHIVENAELRLMTLNQGEEIQQIKQKLVLCQSLLKNKSDWKEYKHKVESTSMVQKTKPQQNNARIQIEQELTRYDAKYKYITWHNNRRENLSTQIYELKMFITKLLRDKAVMEQEKVKLKKDIARKQYELRAMREAQTMMQRQVRLGMIQVQFYRFHFKQLARVSTQRKIKFYSQCYPQTLPKLYKKMNQKSELIKYWKNWEKENNRQSDCSQKRARKRKGKKGRPFPRSNSCSIRLNHIQKYERSFMKNEQKQEGIYSFIGTEHEINMNSVLGCTFEEDYPSRQEKQLFDGQISIITKPSQPIPDQNGNPFRKKHTGIEDELSQ